MKKKSNKDFLEEVYKICGNEYEFLEDYKNSQEKILVKHNTCGYTYKVSPDKFLQGRRCPKCSGKIKNKNTDYFKKELFELLGNEYTVLGEYKKNSEKILIKHNNCGLEYYTTPKILLSGGKCPKCSMELKRQNQYRTEESIKKSIFELVKDEYTLLEPYNGVNNDILIKHNTCGTEYKIKLYNFLKENGTRCPKCSILKNSSYEMEIIDYIKTFYLGEIIQNYKLNNNQEIDIFLPELKIGIEFDGLYWHSEEKRKDKNYHLNKTNLANSVKIRLIHIFEDEWLYKRDIVKSKIRHILKYNTGEKIYARKCIIKEITVKEKNNFLEKNHIQGADKSLIKLGLFYKNFLVSVMTFGKARSALGSKKSKNNKKIIFELIRFANDINYIVIGSFNKILSYFKKNYQFNKIISYADKRWSTDSNLYTSSGFFKTHDSLPNYWYFYSGSKIREHRYSYRKNILKKKFPDIYSDKKTEMTIMLEAGYYKIWDCGNFVYELKKD